MRRVCHVLILVALTAGCGGTRAPHKRPAFRKTSLALAVTSKPRARVSAPPQALVTAETANRLVVVNLPSGRITRRIALPAGPQYVAADPGFALVASPNAGAVSLLGGRPLQIVKVLHGFGAPHITEISPDERYAYVTDDARGALAVIRVSNGSVLRTIQVGAGAHHLTVRPDGQRLWIALGESARRIVMLDSSDPARTRVIGRFDPGFPAHDLSFTPDGARVWITSAAGPDVAVFGARDQRLLFRVPVGPPPQHISFDGAFAYLTSGDASTIEKVDAATGRVVNRARAPYGSFELDVAHGFVVTSSLLRGTLAIYTSGLQELRVIDVAAAARDVVITPP